MFPVMIPLSWSGFNEKLKEWLSQPGRDCNVNHAPCNVLFDHRALRTRRAFDRGVEKSVTFRAFSGNPAAA